MASDCSFPGNLSSQNTSSMALNNSGRNKVALKPGRSLMDWIRFTHSSKDLTSTGGKSLEVSADELSKHNKKTDAWICLKGKVYNITPYFEYHPGGEDELMRGVGKDATDLFNQIHKWVNAESMLQKCLVGRMKSSSLWLQTVTPFPVPKLPQTKNQSLEVKFNPVISSDVVDSVQVLVPSIPKGSGNPVPKFHWSETEILLSLVVYSQWSGLRKHHVIIDLQNGELLISLNIEKYMYQLNLRLEGAVLDNYEVKIEQENGELEIILTKVTPGLWLTLGLPLSRHNSFNEADKKDIQYRPCKLVHKSSVNYNTYLMSFNFPTGTRMLVPIGHHVYVKVCIDGVEIVRSYTPLVQSLILSPNDSNLIDGCGLHLMVKIYDDGTLTPVMKQCKVGETIFISDYIGDFSLEKLKRSSVLVMLAAGTGITPMIGIIHWAVKLHCDQERTILLIFFNKTEKDILWKDELQFLSNENHRFKVHHVLSEPDDEWNGAEGRISKQLLDEFIPIEEIDTQTFVCVCGPLPFTKFALGCLTDLGYSQNDVHTFLG